MYGSPDQPLAVGKLNSITREMLENNLGKVWVRGELIALSTPASGHWYFTLKDNEGQISCALFKYRAPQKLIAAGTEVLLCGMVTLYEPRGQYQMIAESIMPWGIGERHIQFEALKKLLLNEGLLDAHRKKSLPRFPAVIAIISSVHAAGLQDVLVILKRRYPLAGIILYPSVVQGDMAHVELIRAIDCVERDAAKIDVVMMVRGGGSPEDLWCFNNEQLVRRIASMTLPLITGIGHEIDTTLADLVADVRAPTPSAAAEMVVVDALDTVATLKDWAKRIYHITQSRMDHLQLRLDSVRLRLDQPILYTESKKQHMVHLRYAFYSLSKKAFGSYAHKVQYLAMRFTSRGMCTAMRQKYENLAWRLHTSVMPSILRKKEALGATRSRLEAFNPEKLLQGGWAWVEGEDGILKDVNAMQPGSRWRLWVTGGCVSVEVVERL